MTVRNNGEKTEKEYKLTLSSGEIYVLSALTDHNYVFGIENGTLREWGSDISKEAKKVIKSLEKKKKVRCDLDGTVYIEPHIKHIVSCICDADTVCTFTGDLYDGRKKTVYVSAKENLFSTVRESKKGMYEITLCEGFDCRELLPEAKAPGCCKGERILYEEALRVKRQISSFQQSEAEKTLAKCVSEESSVKTLAKLLSGSCKYLDIGIYKKSDRFYRKVFDRVLVSDGELVYQMRLDENRVLFIDPADFSEIYGCFDLHINRRTEQ